MARITNAQLQEQVTAQAAQIDKLIAMIGELTAAGKPAEKKLQPKPKKDDTPDWISAFPPYGTPAQRVEFDKLAKRAAKQYEAVKAAMGCEVKCFIPVPKSDTSKMPHAIKWAGNYAKN